MVLPSGAHHNPGSIVIPPPPQNIHLQQGYDGAVDDVPAK
jgi:hypothetical protein